MSKHTPGPWSVEGDKSILMRGQIVGQAFAPIGASEKQVKANAHLIAAAPELLEAAALLAHSGVVGPEADNDGIVLSSKAFKQLQAAIAKAEGRGE